MTIKKKQKFKLRPFHPGDVPALYKNINNKKIIDNLATVPYPYTLKHARDWVKRCIKREMAKDAVDFVLAIEIDNEAAGAVGLHKIVRNHKAEIGYWLARKHWGKGIMTEAVKLMETRGRKKFGLRRIYAGVFAYNIGSKRVLEKCGFEFEGRQKKEIKKGKKYIDGLLFAKVR